MSDEKYQIKVVKIRNVFKPHWWQIRFRFRVWKGRRAYKQTLAQLSPEGRKIFAEMEQEIERKILFGDK